jgi:hypothetical protein
MPDDGDDVIPAGGTVVENPPWQPWTPTEAAAHLGDLPVPWAVVGGWAIDLFIGHQTRDHEDLEIAIPAGRWAELRHQLGTFDFDVIGSGHRWPLGSDAFALMHQTWVRDPAGVYRLDVMREPHDGDTWICRRDHAIRLPYNQVIRRSPDGVPYQVPEIVLLFKAKYARDKDNADLERALPSLDGRQRAWLARAIQRVHPGHVWLDRLGESLSESPLTGSS